MAISKNIVINHLGQDLHFNNAYIKIVKIEGSKDLLTVDVLIYDEQRVNIIDTRKFDFIPSEDENAVRWDKQGYEYMKTLPAYKDAIDC